MKGLDVQVPVTAEMVPMGTQDAALIFKDAAALAHGLNELRATRPPAPPAPPVVQPAAAVPQPVGDPTPAVDPSGAITFCSTASFLLQALELVTSHGVMGRWTGQVPPNRDAHDFVLRVTGMTGEFPIKGDVAMFQSPMVAITFKEMGPLERCIVAARSQPLQAQAAMAPGGSPGFAAFGSPPPLMTAPPLRAPALNVPLPSGDFTLVNPSPHDLCNVDLTKVPTPDQFNHLSLHQLLLLLRRGRATGTLVLTEDTTSVTVCMDRGVVVLSDADVTALGTLAGHAHVKTCLTTEPAAAPGSAKRRDPGEVAVQVIRAQTKAMLLEELEMIFSHPRLGYLHKATAPASSYFPKLLDKERRFLDLVVDGTRRVVELPAVSGLPRHTTFQLIILLRMFGLVEFRDEGVTTGGSAAQHIALERKRLTTANLFERVGAHWSDHPGQIRSRFAQMQMKYGPTSKNARLAPEDCAEIVKMAQAAVTQLETVQGRKAARMALGGLDMRAAADILVKHAELAAMRHEGTVVLEYLQTAVELHPSAENMAMLRKLTTAIEMAKSSANPAAVAALFKSEARSE